ncbi:MAG: right-handed parallel beta-helix repeat-containing protein [Lachnospiraceae bacterium]|nr:right-handed parallel beta-helix repeat-containing protein [Lachnospiraceae bacterium]
MILDTLTKFNMRRKLWMTPEHPLSMMSMDFKVMYSAALILQAQVGKKTGMLNNYELERLVKAGFKMDSTSFAWALRTSGDNAAVVDYLLDNLKTDRERAFFIMDLVNVSINDGNIEEDSRKSIELFAKMFGVPAERTSLLQRFIEYAYGEDIRECQRFAALIEERVPGIGITDLKYYIMQITETTDFTQKILDEKKNFRLIDRCNIYEDIVLNAGMTLVIDNAVVRIFGNILLNGGHLVINNSKIVRKSDSHRACINLQARGSRAELYSVEADCRNYGMFIRAEEGTVIIENSNIYHTSRGAAVRFWGKGLAIKGTGFYECYSPEDGGAVMARGGKNIIEDCHFHDCEAKRGGAIYGTNGTVISGCRFTRCNVADYGAAVYYSGSLEGRASRLEYSDCHPSGAEIVQHLTSQREVIIKGEYHIGLSTIIDCPVSVGSGGRLVIENANIYLNYPLRCLGSLIISNVRIVSNHLEGGDMLYLDNAKECNIHHCELDGMLKTGGINLLNTRISITKSLFRNMDGGRAVYNAYQPEISDCIFNFCQKGAVYSQGGNIERCVFINCRAKSGAGVQMYGRKGIIKNCIFRRCVSEYSGGAVDRVAGMRVEKCTYEDCRPDNIS